MTANPKLTQSSSAATGEKPSFLLFGGLALIGLLKDTLDLIGIGSLPAIGLVVTAGFSFFSFMLLLLFDRSGGRGNKRLAQGMVVTMGTLVEGIGFVINFLPLQTLTAIFLYLISYKSWKHSQRAAAVVARSQRSKLQTQTARMARAIALREERMRQQAATDDVPATEETNVPTSPSVPRMARAVNVPGPAPQVLSPQTLPIVPYQGGHAIDIGRGEIVGEYATAEEARQAMPEALRMRDAREAHLQKRNAPSGVATPTPVSRPAAISSRGTSGMSPASSRPSSTPIASRPLPITKTAHGYTIDIGRDEVVGEYATLAEARQAMPEALRIQSERDAYLASRAAPANDGRPQLTVPSATRSTTQFSAVPQQPTATPSTSNAAQSSVATASPVPGPKTMARPVFTKLKNLSTDASARVREAGSRLSQTVRPKVSASLASASERTTQQLQHLSEGATKRIRAAGGQLSAMGARLHTPRPVTPAAVASAPRPASNTPAPASRPVTKEQLFADRLRALRRDPLRTPDDSAAVDVLFQATPEFQALKAERDEEEAFKKGHEDRLRAINSYLGVKEIMRDFHGSREYMSETNQLMRRAAVGGLVDSGFYKPDKHPETEDSLWARAGMGRDNSIKQLEDNRKRMAYIDQKINKARSQFGSTLQREYVDFLNQQKNSASAAGSR